MPKASRKAIERYKAAHWGIEAKKVYEVADPDLPPELVEMGKLRELYVDARGGPYGKYELHFSGNCMLAWTDDRVQRLYNVLTKTFERGCKADLWEGDVGSREVYRLPEVAAMAGGRHARLAHVDIPVRILGDCTHIVYETWKKGDDDDVGGAFYKHEFGEETHKPPILCVDAKGRLWFAGGGYTVETAGICD